MTMRFCQRKINHEGILEGKNMATLDWSQCPAVESVPGKVSGAWVLRGTRMPVSAIFERGSAEVSAFCFPLRYLELIRKE